MRRGEADRCGRAGGLDDRRHRVRRGDSSSWPVLAAHCRHLPDGTGTTPWAGLDLVRRCRAALGTPVRHPAGPRDVRSGARGTGVCRPADGLAHGSRLSGVVVGAPVGHGDALHRGAELRVDPLVAWCRTMRPALKVTGVRERQARGTGPGRRRMPSLNCRRARPDQMRRA